MTDTATIVARLRAKGANVEIADGGLRLVTRSKLPPGSEAFVTQHGAEIADYLRDETDAVETSGRRFVAADNDGDQKPGAVRRPRMASTSPCKTTLPYVMRPTVGTDFNDILVNHGLFAVQRLISTFLREAAM